MKNNQKTLDHSIPLDSLAHQPPLRANGLSSAAGSLRLSVGDVVEYKMSNGSAYHVKLANAESVEIARESLIEGRCKKVSTAEENKSLTQPAHHNQC